jgi:hypothetical protein
VSLDTMNQTFNVYVAKFTPAGAHLWSVGYGDTAYQVGAAVTTDAEGNVFAAGHFNGSMNVGAAGTLTSVGDLDAFVLGFAP